MNLFITMYSIFNDVNEFICNEFIYHEIFNDVNELFVMNLFITKYSTMLMNYL